MERWRSAKRDAESLQGNYLDTPTNEIDAGADESADVAYVQLPNEAFHPHFATSRSDRM